MRSRSWLVLVLLGAGQSVAAPKPFPSVVGGTTVAPDEFVLDFGLGRSDAISAGWRFGVAPWLELGLSGSGLFGYRGILFVTGSTRGAALGAKAQVRMKARLLAVGPISLAVTFEPGLSYLHWTDLLGRSVPVEAVGIELPVALKFGLALSSRVILGLRAELPFFLEFQNGVLAEIDSFAYGPRVGLGVEVVLSDSVLLFFHVRTAPLSIVRMPIIDGQLGLAWRLPWGES